MTTRAPIIAGKTVILLQVQDSVDKALQGVRNKLKKFANSLSNISGDLFRGGLVGTLPVGLITKEFKDFEDEILFLSTKLDATEDQFKSLETTIRDLGKSTSFTAKEVAEGATILAQAGLTAEQVQKTLLPTLDLARGARITLSAAGEILANTMASFSIEGSRAAEVASQFVKAARLGTLDVLDLKESIKEMLGTARNLNIDLPTTLALLTQLAQRSLKGTKAGTSLNTALLQLASKQKVIAESLNIQLPDNINGDQFIVFLEKLYQKLNRLGNLQRTAVLQSIFNIRGGRAITAADDIKRIIELQKAIRNAGNEARTAATKMDSGFGGSIRKATSAVNDLAITLGQVLGNQLKDLLKIIPPITDAIQDLIKKFPEITTIALAIPPTLLAIGVAGLSASFVFARLAGVVGVLSGVLNNFASTSLRAVNGQLALAVATGTALGFTTQRRRVPLSTPKANIAIRRETDKLSRVQRAKTKNDDAISLEEAKQVNANRIKLAKLYLKRQKIVESIAKISFAIAQARRAAELVQSGLDTTFVQKTLGKRIPVGQTARAIASPLGNAIEKGFDIVKAKGLSFIDFITEAPKPKAKIGIAQRLRALTRNIKAIDIGQTINLNRAKLVARINSITSIIKNTFNKFSTKGFNFLEKLFTPKNTKTVNGVRDRLIKLRTEQASLAKGVSNLTKKRDSLNKSLNDSINREKALRRAARARANLERATETRRQLGKDLRARQGRATFNTARIKLALGEATNDVTKLRRELINLPATTETASIKSKLQFREALKEQLSINKANVQARKEAIKAELDVNNDGRTSKVKKLRKELTLLEKTEVDLTRQQGNNSGQITKLNKELNTRTAINARITRTEADLNKAVEKRNKLQKLLNRNQTRTSLATSQLKAQFQTALLDEKRLRKEAISFGKVDPNTNLINAEVERINRKDLQIERDKVNDSIDTERKKAPAILKTRKELGEKLAKIEDRLQKRREARAAARTKALFAGIRSAISTTFSGSLGIFKGLFQAFRTLGSVISKIDFIKILYNMFRGIGFVIKALYLGIGAVRRFVFSFSGILTIVEFLLLFGDRITFIKNAMDRVGTGFRNAFKTIGGTIEDAAKGFSLFSEGFKSIVRGDGKIGLNQMIDALRLIWRIIKDNIKIALNDIVFAFAPVIQFLSDLISGIGDAFGLIFNLTAKLGSSLSNAFKELFPKDGIKVSLPSGQRKEDKSFRENFFDFFKGVLAFIQGLFIAIKEALQLMINVVIHTMLAIQTAIQTVFGLIATIVNGSIFFGEDAKKEANKAAGRKPIKPIELPPDVTVGADGKFYDRNANVVDLTPKPEPTETDVAVKDFSTRLKNFNEALDKFNESSFNIFGKATDELTKTGEEASFEDAAEERIVEASLSKLRAQKALASLLNRAIFVRINQLNEATKELTSAFIQFRFDPINTLLNKLSGIEFRSLPSKAINTIGQTIQNAAEKAFDLLNPKNQKAATRRFTKDKRKDLRERTREIQDEIKLAKIFNDPEREAKAKKSLANLIQERKQFELSINPNAQARAARRQQREDLKANIAKQRQDIKAGKIPQVQATRASLQDIVAATVGDFQTTRFNKFKVQAGADKQISLLQEVSGKLGAGNEGSFLEEISKKIGPPAFVQ